MLEARSSETPSHARSSTESWCGRTAGGNRRGHIALETAHAKLLGDQYQLAAAVLFVHPATATQVAQVASYIGSYKCTTLIETAPLLEPPKLCDLGGHLEEKGRHRGFGEEGCRVDRLDEAELLVHELHLCMSAALSTSFPAARANKNSLQCKHICRTYQGAERSKTKVGCSTIVITQCIHQHAGKLIISNELYSLLLANFFGGVTTKYLYAY